ncbi:hypothetical protein [Rothia nasimurium]|uniref:hypothetical protein n=1 Tax=Rothia nasimurium TaxID=85336 RepID=UPI001F23E27C|nr:hypothetical protein [Rothia nasimurium]
MANATKAQRNYLETLTKKASAEDKTLALQVAKAELNITDEWDNVRAENLDGYRWEKHEASILIDVLSDPDYYREDAAEADTIELTEEEIQAITNEKPRRARRGGTAPASESARIAEARGVETNEIISAYTVHFGAKDFIEAKKIARSLAVIAGQEKEAAEAYAKAEETLSLICFNSETMDVQQRNQALEAAAVAVEDFASVAHLAGHYATAQHKTLNRTLPESDYRAWTQGRFACGVEEADFYDGLAGEIAEALRSYIR